MTATLVDFTIGKDGRLPELAITFEDDTGAIDISGATSVVIYLQNAATGAYKLNGVAATKLDDGTTANRGKAKYAWATGDTDTAGLYKCWFRATLSGRDLYAPKRPSQPFLLVLIV
jgi:hypothetical protein